MDINADNDFEAAFADAVGVEPETPEAAAAVEPDTAVEAEAEVTPTAEEPEVAEPAANTEVESTAAEPASVAPVAAEPAPAAPQIDPKYLAQAMLEAQQQAEQLRQQQAEQAKSSEPPQAPSYEDYLTPEQKAQVEQLNTEWTEVAGPVQALIAAHVQAALATAQQQQQQLLAQVQQQMAPIQQATAQSQEALYWNTIAAAHPDFREVAPNLPAWIEEQPFKVAQQYLAQYQSGNPADAVALLAAYKQATGSTGAAPMQPASSAVQATPTPAPVPKAALAATAAVPPAQRSKVTSSRDPNDADAAFRDAFAAR